MYFWLGSDSQELYRARQKLVDALDREVVCYSTQHEFKPHISLSYVPHGEDVLLSQEREKFKVTSFWIMAKNFKQEFPLRG